MRKKHFFLILLVLSFGSLNRIKAQVVVNARDFGITEVEDATPVIWRAIQKCKEINADILLIPTGTYHFYPTQAYEKYLSISNHDNGLKRIGFPIIELNNLVIDGGNSTFIFHDYMIPVVVEDSKEISFKNFSIDWHKPFYLQGTVVKVSPDQNSFQLKISEENDYEIIGEELRFNVFGKKYNLVQNLWFDPIKKGTVYDVESYKIDPWNPNNRLSYKATDLGNRIVEIQHSVAKLPQEGWIFVAKGRTADNRSRYSPGIHINRSETISFDNINIYHAGGMGLIGEKSENISMSNFNVLLNAQKHRIVSTTADATHFVNCKGIISFDNCIFENMLDDATNVHGTYLKVYRINNKNSLLFKTIHFQQFGFEFVQKGDTVRVIDQSSLKPKQILRVKEVRVFNEEYQQVEFFDKIDANIEPEDLVENLTWTASVSMKNCKVSKNRARGILVKVSRPIRVENCYFSSMMSAISIGSAGGGFWCESGPVADVVIRNNHFENNCTGGRKDAIIEITPLISKIEPDFYFNKNIIIENNKIETFNKYILCARSTDNLIFKNNNISLTDDFLPFESSENGIKIENSKNIQILENSYTGESTIKIQIDSETRKSSIIEKNKGLK